MMKIEHLSFKFKKNSNYFFKDLFGCFPDKRINFIRGANGSGKTTFFRILNGELSEHEELVGNFYLNGQQTDYTTLADQIQMVPQKFDTMLADAFSFEENLRFANLSEYPTLSRLSDYKNTLAIIKDLGVQPDVPVRSLSGGQRQILSIIMALQNEASVLLLDEPTSALDAKNSVLVMEFLEQLVRETNLTIIMICHDASIIDTYATDGYHEIDENIQNGARTFEYKKRRTLIKHNVLL